MVESTDVMEEGAGLEPRRPVLNISQSLKLAAEHWPQLFGKNPRLPFKVGILQDLVRNRRERGIDLSIHELRIMLRCFCGLPKYHMAITPGAMRHDIHGQPVCEVQEKHVLNAQKQLNRLRQRMKDSKPINSEVL